MAITDVLSRRGQAHRCLSPIGRKHAIGSTIDRALRGTMTITTENQAVIPTHRWQGIASSIIGVISVMITLLLGRIAMSGTEPSGLMLTALAVVPSAMLCANLIGIGLGIF